MLSNLEDIGKTIPMPSDSADQPRKPGWRQKLAKYLFAVSAGIGVLAVIGCLYVVNPFNPTSETIEALRQACEAICGEQANLGENQARAVMRVVYGQRLLCILSVTTIAGLAFFSTYSKVQLWTMRLFTLVFTVITVVDLVSMVSVDAESGYLEKVTGTFLAYLLDLLILCFLFFVAEPNPTPQGVGNYRHKPALYLAAAHAVGIICFLKPVMFGETWVPVPWAQPMWHGFAFAFAVVTYFTASRSTPKLIHLTENILWCVYAGYLALSTQEPEGVYSVCAMRVFFVSHILALGGTIRDIVNRSDRDMSCL